MGMNFSPMYQPVSTKTIKADGDLNINPYDLLATDVKCDTVEASEFVGGVGNFSSNISTVFKYTGFLTTDINSPSPIASIPSISSGSFTGDKIQTVQNLTSVPEYPTIAGLFDISEATFDGDFYLRFTCTIPASSSATTTMGIYKNNVRQTTVLFNRNEGSKTVSIKVPYGDKSIWGFKWESGNLIGVSGYSLTLNELNLYGSIA